MDPSLPSVISSLDDSLALFCGSLGEIQAAKSIDDALVIDQFKAAAESAEKLRTFIFSEMPDASWESREQLDSVLDQIQKNLEARRLEALRSRLLDLAAELERGNIVHRRAARVAELNQLRAQAIDELLSQASSDAAPRELPGPEAHEWIDWACELKEPEDTDSLRRLRDGFARLDDFVANLEPDMWVIERVSTASRKEREAAEQQAKAEEARAAEERRTRLLALASELEGGRVVHHRAFRVSQLNQLRDQAIAELRSQAEPGSKPKELPGPEASYWIEWACSLQEPEDTLSLESLRKGFASLDDFVANLEFEMWVAPGATPPEAQEPPKSQDPKPPQATQPPARRVEPAVATAPAPPVAVAAVEVPATPAPVAVTPSAPATAKLTKAERRLQRQHALAKPAVVAAPAAAAVAVAAATAAAPAQTGRPLSAFELIQSERAETASTNADQDADSMDAPNVALVGVGGLTPDRVQYLKESMATVAREEDELDSFYAKFAAKAEELLGSKWRVVLATVAVLVLVVMGTALWKLHKNSASNNPVKAAERADASRTPDSKGYDPSGMTAMAATPPAAQPVPDKQTKTKDQAATDKSKQTPTPTDTTPAPEPVKEATLLDNGGLRTPTAMPKNAAKKEEASAEGPAPGILPYGAGSNATLNNVVNGMPVAQPKIAPQKVRVSSGVAQGMLVHRVTPQYPTQARQQGIQGTVVLQAVIGKDGGVKSVKAVSGNSMLRQAAVDAVKQWKYKPYSVDGEAVEADTEINVKFSPSE